MSNGNETTMNQPTGAQPQSISFDAPFQALIMKMSKDMSFLGIIAVIAGALDCLTIIGAAIGIPVIFAGIRLRESADAFRSYALNQDTYFLHHAIERQERYFFIWKVLAIVGICLVALYIIFIIIFVIVAGTTFLKLAM
jgi:hypothetical protein